MNTLLTSRHPQVGLLLFSASIACRFLVTSGVLRRALSASASAPHGRLHPPVAIKSTKKMYFGVSPVDPELYLGEQAMNPPLERVDDYHWLRDDTRKHPDVLSHLHAENDYCMQEMKPLESFQNTLYEEMLSHLKETDADVPYKHGHYFYYTRTEKGKAYKIYCRKYQDITATEEVILDVNNVAKGQAYTDMGSIQVSPSHHKLAYSVDFSGYETYAIHILANIQEGKLMEDKVENTDGTIVWGNDDSAFFYMAMDAEHRPNKIFLHILGTSQDQDICLLEENDGRFWMGIEKTADDRYLILGAGSKETSEYYFVDLQGISGGDAHRQLVPTRLTCFAKRKQGLRYEVEHHNGYFYFITNANQAKNNKLTRVAVDKYQSGQEEVTVEAWEDLHTYNPKEQIDSIIPFANKIAIFGRCNGLAHLWLMDDPVRNPQAWTSVTFPEEDFSLWAGDNHDFHAPALRLVYTSFITPRQIVDYDLTTGKIVIRKQDEVPGYAKEKYECRRVHAPSRDGHTQIPLSMVYNKKALKKDNSLQLCPVLLYGYGSYGACIDPSYDFKRLSMLDRGVVFIIAHIRGGGEMGRSWYEDEGKYLTKMNTFYDFIDCAKYLIDTKVTTKQQLAVVGRSAGGLLIGACVNLAPELYQTAVADVPFVDVLNTMSDPSIPLTVTEWEEWGNPNEEKFHHYMANYSPYDNVRAQNYPSMLVTGGLNDPRVPYWEPAKWVAKLRATKTDKNPLYFKTDMSSGHFSASDRYKYIKETAFEHSFILNQIKAKELL